MPVAERKVAIVGTAITTRQLAPFLNQAFEIWCTGGDSAKSTPRFTRWYEVHDPSILLDPTDAAFEPWHKTHIEWLAGVNGSMVYVPNATEHLPEATVFDYRAVVGTFTPEFITSGPALMLAHLLYEELIAIDRLDHLEIQLFGIDMADDDERKDQWLGVQHFVLLAESHGATVLVPEGSALVRTKLPYPMCGETELVVGLRHRQKVLEGLKKHFEIERDNAAVQVTSLGGALEEVKRILRLNYS